MRKAAKEGLGSPEDKPLRLPAEPHKEHKGKLGIPTPLNTIFTDKILPTTSAQWVKASGRPGLKSLKGSRRQVLAGEPQPTSHWDSQDSATWTRPLTNRDPGLPMKSLLNPSDVPASWEEITPTLGIMFEKVHLLLHCRRWQQGWDGMNRRRTRWQKGGTADSRTHMLDARVFTASTRAPVSISSWNSSHKIHFLNSKI